MLLSQHPGTLLSQALVAAAVAQLLGTAEGVAVGGVLAELRPLQAVLLIETDVVQGLTVAVSGRRRFPACRCLRVKTTEPILMYTTLTQKHPPSQQIRSRLNEISQVSYNYNCRHADTGSARLSVHLSSCFEAESRFSHLEIC